MIIREYFVPLDAAKEIVDINKIEQIITLGDNKYAVIEVYLHSGKFDPELDSHHLFSNEELIKLINAAEDYKDFYYNPNEI
jgi:hypothetical protein